MSDPVAAHPAQVATLFTEAWNRRDPDALAALFDEDAEFVNVVGLWWHDREAIRRAHAYGLAHLFEHSSLRVVQTRVKHLSDAVAVVHARMRLEGQTPIDGVAAPGPRTNVFTFVVHRVDEGTGWRCAAAHNTDVVPHRETWVHDADGQLRPVRGPGTER